MATKKKGLPTSHCGHCDAQGNDHTVSLKACIGCMSVMYCDTACQRAAWPNHKALCKNIKKKQQELKLELLRSTSPSNSAATTAVHATSANVEKRDECSICLNSYVSPLTLECKHVFCRDCITRWRSQQSAGSCPLCRGPLLLDENPERACELAFRLTCQARRKTDAGDFEAARRLNVEARDHIMRAFGENLVHSEALSILGNIEEDMGADPIPFFERALAADNDNIDAQANIGRYFMNIEQYEEGISAYRATLHLEERLAGTGTMVYHALQQIHFNLGTALKRREIAQFDEAITHLECAARLAECPEDECRALTEMGIAFERKGDLPKSIAVLRRAIAIAPRFSRHPYFTLGLVLHDSGKHKKARKTLMDGLTFEDRSPPPGYPHLQGDMYVMIGHLSVQLADYPEARKSYDLALQHLYEPTSQYRKSSVHITYAKFLKDRLKEYESAIVQFQAATVLEPDNADAHFCTGVCHACLGQLKQHVKAVCRAEDLAPGITLQQGMEEVPSALQHLMRMQGKRVKLRGLTSKPELNGIVGTVTDVDFDKMRCSVVCSDFQEPFSIKPSNLAVL